MQTKFLAAVRRPAAVGVAVGVALTGAFFLGQAQAQDEFRLNTPTLIYVQIKPDKIADYEAVIGKLKDALRTTDKPELKQAAMGWRIFKSDAPANGSTLYIHFIDPPAPTADYTVMKILYDAFPAESTNIYNQYRDAFVGQSAVKLSLVANLGQR